MTVQFPISIGLHRSLFLGLAMAVAHLLAAIVVLAPLWQVGFKVALLTGLAGSGIAAWLCWQPRVDCLRLLDDGRLECRLAGKDGFFEAELLPGATVHPWLTVVPLKIASRKLVVVVLPDSIRAEEFRRLRVWLRWRADFSAVKNAA